MVTQYFRAHSSKWSDMSLGGVGRLGCGGQNSVPPGRCPLLIPGACDNAILCGQRDTADMNKLKIWGIKEGDTPRELKTRVM